VRDREEERKQTTKQGPKTGLAARDIDKSLPAGQRRRKIDPDPGTIDRDIALRWKRGVLREEFRVSV